MRKVTSLMQESLLIAEAQEDENYSIDFEALL